MNRRRFLGSLLALPLAAKAAFAAPPLRMVDKEIGISFRFITSYEEAYLRPAMASLCDEMDRRTAQWMAMAHE